MTRRSNSAGRNTWSDLLAPPAVQTSALAPRRVSNPFVPADPIAALGKLLELVRFENDVAPELRLWLSHAERAYRTGEAATLDEAFGVGAARPGGRWETSAARQRYKSIRSSVRIVALQIPGTIAQRAARMAELFKTVKGPPLFTRAEEAAWAVLKCCPDLPRSKRQLQRILKKSDIKCRDDVIPNTSYIKEAP